MRFREHGPPQADARRTATRRRVARMVAAGFVMLAGAAGTARAQTRFTPPDTTVDVATYTTLEECVAATARVREGMARRERQVVWNDTLPWKPKESLDPLPAPVVETARRCSARFPAATVPLSDFSLILPLYLVANRDSDVITLAHRRLAAAAEPPRRGARAPTAAEVRAVRAALEDSVFQAYLSARPVRMAAADSLARAADHSARRPLDAASGERLTRMYMALALKDETLGDTVDMRAMGARTVSLVDSLTPVVRQEVRERAPGGSMAFDMFLYTAHLTESGLGVLLDSLRRGTLAYLEFQRSLWVKSTGDRVEAAGFPIGKLAPTLTGAELRAPNGVAGPRPVPGKVNLIVFVDAMCTDVIPSPMRLNVPSICRPQAATLRRIAARYPALEITLVDRTRGYFMYVPPPSPAQEAALDSAALQAHGMPGTLVLGTTAFFRLDAPDSRRIAKRELPDFTPYTFGKSWSADNGAAFLVDRNGIIVYASGQIGREFEGFVGDMIGILLAQHGAAAQAGSPDAMSAPPRR